MGDWILSIAGTPQGAQLALVLALSSALFHAAFGALQKGRYHPFVIRGVIDVWLLGLSLPIALFLVPWPTAQGFLILLGAAVLHFFYKMTVALAYERAAYTVVYPVIRGTGPVVTVLAAAAIFHEHFTALQWAGVACLSGAMLLLALRNLSEEKLDGRGLRIGLVWALAGGLMVALYTVYDAWGIRLAANPFTFLAWFFVITSLDMPLIAAYHVRRFGMAGSARTLVWRGAIGAVIAWASFGGVLLATRLDKVGEAAVLRETSPVFAALIGWFILGEKVGPRRLALMGMIALGAVMVELGGR
ncbi:multidrug transporter [Loktanella sp. IMCC34160]|uniref:DMT family transporter n=1 Tax=Loktanella sp. IMCC34160 TaxID=2510646 RepID=UPI00101D51C6|nr:DMT family transporter [Loktanella sp. IMCC34160]RYG90903.1 multidrug transporter [Loktanella sp. IMCC34160]